MTTRVLRIGVVGIGRIGRQHALNALRGLTTKLVAVCSPANVDQTWAKENVVPFGVTAYGDLTDMLRHEGLQAVVIASTTKFHAEHVRQCIDAGFHVLCEKPLAMTIDQAISIKEHAAEKPELVVMTGYSRRFDASYQNAVTRIQAGQIGTPLVVRSQTCDKYDRSEFYMRYIMANPGIFIDTCIHDIDLTLSFFGSGARPKSAYATGTVSLHPELVEIQDVDNAVGVVEFYPEPSSSASATAIPKRISYYYLSRIMKHGFDNATEIVGTDGIIKVNMHPRRDLLEVAGEQGLGNDVMPDFYERYEKSFVEELKVFAECALGRAKVPYELATAIKGMEIAEGLQESLRTGTKVEWDERGNRT